MQVGGPDFLRPLAGRWPRGARCDEKGSSRRSDGRIDAGCVAGRHVRRYLRALSRVQGYRQRAELRDGDRARRGQRRRGLGRRRIDVRRRRQQGLGVRRLRARRQRVHLGVARQLGRARTPARSRLASRTAASDRAGERPTGGRRRMGSAPSSSRREPGTSTSGAAARCTCRRRGHRCCSRSGRSRSERWSASR